MDRHQEHWLKKPKWVKNEKKRDLFPFIIILLLIPFIVNSFYNATYPEPDHSYNLRVVGTVRDIDYSHNKILLESKDGSKMGYSFKDRSHYLQNNTQYIFQSTSGHTIAETGYTMKEIYQHNNDWTWVDEMYLVLGWTGDFKHMNILIGDPNILKGGCMEN